MYDLEQLIETMKKSGVLKSAKLKQAIRETPRHDFVPVEMQKFAYNDNPLPIGYNQTISQPSTVVLMTETLDIKNDDKILEIGTGSGWQAAILARLAKNGFVYTTEIVPELAEFAKKNMQKMNIRNVRIFNTDGSLGLKKYAPFSKIIMTAAAKDIPEELIKQLKIYGKMIIPIGDIQTQKMTVITKLKRGLEIRKLPGFFVFVPLKGKYGFER